MADETYQATMATIAAGRVAAVARLRALATRLDELPLDTAADVLVLVEPGSEPERSAGSRHGS